jgi:ATP-dependent RNA helicase RhlB
VLDEADRMLSMGFIPDVRTIIRNTPRKGDERQTLLYSATFTDDIMSLARQWTDDPVQIEIEAERRSTENISQKVFLVSSHEKYKLLRNYIRLNNIERVIVFGNRRHETRDLAEKLKKDGVRAALMSGEIPQHKRVKTLEDFKSGKIEVLVATDVAGRGIHIDGVTHVVNYQLPEDAEDYVHRIGRTGRAGATGTSICFACENDSFMIPDIEEETGVKLECIHPSEELLADPNAYKTAAPVVAVAIEPVVEAIDSVESSVKIADNVEESAEERVEEIAEESAAETSDAASVELPEKAPEAVFSESVESAKQDVTQEAPQEAVVEQRQVAKADTTPEQVELSLAAPDVVEPVSVVANEDEEKNRSDV